MALKARLAEILEQQVEGRGTAGIAVKTAGTAWPVTAWVPGSADEEPGYLAYSITKTFIAVLVLLLRDQRRVSLDDRLARWLPGLAGAERISLRQLLNHTAGVPDYGGVRAYHEDVRASPSAPWSFERFVTETLEKGLSFAPGSGWAYSNPGYMFVKRITEQVGGSSFATLILERIARPLGLARTFVPESVGDSPRSLRPHPDRWLMMPPLATCATTIIPAGSLTESWHRHRRRSRAFSTRCSAGA